MGPSLYSLRIPVFERYYKTACIPNKMCYFVRSFSVCVLGCVLLCSVCTLLVTTMISLVDMDVSFHCAHSQILETNQQVNILCTSYESYGRLLDMAHLHRYTGFTRVSDIDRTVLGYEKSAC